MLDVPDYKAKLNDYSYLVALVDAGKSFNEIARLLECQPKTVHKWAKENGILSKALFI